MDDDRAATPLQGTELDPGVDHVELLAWVEPLRCGGCGGRVDTWLRYNRSDDARCSDCGAEWRLN